MGTREQFFNLFQNTLDTEAISMPSLSHTKTFPQSYKTLNKRIYKKHWTLSCSNDIAQYYKLNIAFYFTLKQECANICVLH